MFNDRTATSWQTPAPQTFYHDIYRVSFRALLGRSESSQCLSPESLSGLLFSAQAASGSNLAHYQPELMLGV